MTSSWKSFRWRHLLHFYLALTISAEEILEFNGRSFTPPKNLDSGNWIPSSLLTFSEHWVPLKSAEVSDFDDSKAESSEFPKSSLFDSIGTFRLKESSTESPVHDPESVTWFVKSKDDNRRIISTSSSKDHHDYHPMSDDFEYVSKNHKLENSPQPKYPYSNNEPIYGRPKEQPIPVYDDQQASAPSNVKTVQYMPDQYSKLKEELQQYYRVPVPYETQQSVPQNVGASLSFGPPSREEYGQFSLPRPYFDIQKPPVQPSRTEHVKEPSHSLGTYYPGFDPSSVSPAKKPLVVGMTYDDYVGHQSIPESVPSDLSLINSPYSRKPPYQLSNKPHRNRPNKPQKTSMMDRVMDFIYNFQERQGINNDKFSAYDRPGKRPNNRPSLRPQPDRLYTEPLDYGKPTKQRPVYHKPNSLVDRMVEAVHTYFQRGYAANKRKPYGSEKVGDGGLGTAPLGAVGLAAAIASVIWYGVSKGTTPVVTARQEGSPVDMDALFANIDKLEEVIDNVEFMEKYSKGNSSFVDMVQELVSHLAQKDGKKLDV